MVKDITVYANYIFMEVSSNKPQHPYKISYDSQPYDEIKFRKSLNRKLINIKRKEIALRR